MSSRSPHTSLAVAAVGGCLAGVLPALAVAVTVPAQKVARPPVARVGNYEIVVDRIVSHPPMPAPVGGAPVPPSVTLGLRVLPATREAALRFEGVTAPLILTDELGRAFKVAALPAGPHPSRRDDASSVLGVKDFTLRMLLPDDRAGMLRSIEGELAVSEVDVYKIEVMGRDLAQGVERKLADYILKLAPVTIGDTQTEVRFSLGAKLVGKQLSRERFQAPTVVVDLHDARGRTHGSRSGRYTSSTQGAGFASGHTASFSGDVPPRLSGALLAAAAAQGGFKSALPPRSGPLARPLPETATVKYDSTLKFDALPKDAPVKSVAVYLVLPPTAAKALPFRITNVALPLPEGQQQP